ncbi:MAG: DUF4007 family protein [Chitinophagales bacterium]
MDKLHFSGHDSFICKQFWLKKGYDFISENKSFSDDTAVIDLGVGKNMVGSIRYWLKSFGIADENDSLQHVSDYLFAENGKDPFIEDIGTIWLLHYHLVAQGKASIYSLVFNQFRKERFDFTKSHLHNFIKRACLETESNYNENTVNTDINVFLKNYTKPKTGKISVEDDFIGLLQDLDLLKQYKLTNVEAKEFSNWYKIDNEKREDLPFQIVLYAILNKLKDQENSISFKEMQIGFNAPGLVFALNAEGLFNKIKAITEYYPEIIFSETAGNQVLQFKSKPEKFEVLNDYYQ